MEQLLSFLRGSATPHAVTPTALFLELHLVLKTFLSYDTLTTDSPCLIPTVRASLSSVYVREKDCRVNPRYPCTCGLVEPLHFFLPLFAFLSSSFAFVVLC
jgi:hypothetical protein